MKYKVNSKTNCPTCGTECTISGEGETHFYTSKQSPAQQEVDWEIIKKGFDRWMVEYKSKYKEFPHWSDCFDYFRKHPQFQSNPTGAKINYKERYEKIANSDWFKKAYAGYSIGEVIALNESGEQNNQSPTVEQIKKVLYKVCKKSESNEGINTHCDFELQAKAILELFNGVRVGDKELAFKKRKNKKK